MSFWPALFHRILNPFVKFLVKSKAIPQNPIAELNLDKARPILYVLPYRSQTDLLTMRYQCLALGLSDPLTPLIFDDQTLPAYVFISDRPRVFGHAKPKWQSIELFHRYLDLHRNAPQLDIQLLPVSVLFGRSPGREGQTPIPYLRLLNVIQKFFTLFWLGRDSFVRFSNTVSLRRMADEHGTDSSIAHKLARVAQMHFSRQRLAAVGPRLPARKALFDQLLRSRAIEKAIQDEARSKKISPEKARQTAVKLLEEIAADFRYGAVRLTDRILSWTWNRLYQGINVRHVERIRSLAQEGHELVYIPCHRSHMDYLLLSYVLYHQGLVPPHIAAGINLNFWPAGPIFRRLGAFFIRRSFKGNKLYSTIFREYLGELFNRGYAVEYFIEGGRSRTGRLLDPKTGTLSMTLQALLRGCNRPITLVPVYIGYEHVIEVATYANELRGAAKQKESFWQLIRSVRKLRNLGQGYVNFGQPVPLMPYLNQQVPDWRDDINPLDLQRPAWLSPCVNQLARHIMVKINNAAAVNAINLCATVLLASRQRALTKNQLLEQLVCYLQLLRQVPYSEHITLPLQDSEQLLAHALSMNVFTVEQDSIGELIILPRQQALLMTYYRNNIQHLFILPALLASLILHHPAITLQEIRRQISLLYPLLKEELFLHYSIEQLFEVIDHLLSELAGQKLILCEEESISLNLSRIQVLQLLAAGIKETLQRYTITLAVLTHNPGISRSLLEKESQTIAQRLSVLHGINSPEFFDKAVFTTLVNTLKTGGYITENVDTPGTRIRILYSLLSDLLSPEIQLTINSAASGD